MNTLLLGAQLLSNLIHTLVPLSDEDSFGELLGNCKDAIEEVMDPIIIFATKKIGDKIYVCIYDNGISMEPQGMFMASTSFMKKNKIGKFFKGGLKSLLSICPNRVYEFTKKISNTQKMCIYKIGNMIEKNRNMFSSGCSSDEVNNTITSQCYIIGPRVKGDTDNGISTDNYQRSLDVFIDISEIKSFKESNDNDIQGTCLILEFSEDSNIIEKLDNFFATLPYKQKDNKIIKYYKESILQEMTNLSNNPFEKNIVMDSPFIYDIEKNKLYLVRNNGKKYLVEYINGKNNYKESNETYEPSKVEKFSVRYTIVSDDMNTQQLANLPINNGKVLRQIFIETDYLYLGFGGKVTIPNKFLGKNSSSSRAGPIHSRSCIKISEKCENLYRILGINEEKNTPKMNKSDNPIVDAILQYSFDFKEFQEKKLGVFLNKGEQQNLYKEFLENGYKFLDGEMSVKDKISKNGFCEETSQYINQDEIYKRIIDYNSLAKVFKDEWKENLIKPSLKKNQEIETDSESAEGEESEVEAEESESEAEETENEVEETENEVEEAEESESEAEETETEEQIREVQGEHGTYLRENDETNMGDAKFIESQRKIVLRFLNDPNYERRDDLIAALYSTDGIRQSTSKMAKELKLESPGRSDFESLFYQTLHIVDPVLRMIEYEKLMRQQYYEICGRKSDGQMVLGGNVWRKLFREFTAN